MVLIYVYKIVISTKIHIKKSHTRKSQKYLYDNLFTSLLDGGISRYCAKKRLNCTRSYFRDYIFADDFLYLLAVADDERKKSITCSN